MGLVRQTSAQIRRWHNNSGLVSLGSLGAELGHARDQTKDCSGGPVVQPDCSVPLDGIRRRKWKTMIGSRGLVPGPRNSCIVCPVCGTDAGWLLGEGTRDMAHFLCSIASATRRFLRRGACDHARVQRAATCPLSAADARLFSCSSLSPREQEEARQPRPTTRCVYQAFAVIRRISSFSRLQVLDAAQDPRFTSLSTHFPSLGAYRHAIAIHSHGRR